MTILGDQRGHVERRARTQDRADIVRVGHLVENHQRASLGLFEHFIERHIVERGAFEHETLMGRIARHEARQIDRLGIFHRQFTRQFSIMVIEHGLNRLARAPQLLGGAVGVGEGGLDRVAAPEPHGPGRTAARPAPPGCARPARAARVPSCHCPGGCCYHHRGGACEHLCIKSKNCHALSHPH
jgi:hypothetical protein